MRFSREFKVGLAVLAAILIFIFGVRFMEDVPLFRGTYTLHTALDDASGLSSGNAVQLNGVKVGSVEEVSLSKGANQARVDFRIKEDVTITEGARTRVGGFSALGNVYLKIIPGPSSNPALSAGGFVPAATEPTGINAVVNDLEERAPKLFEHFTSVLENADETLHQTNQLLANSNSDLRQTLTSVRQSARTLESLMQSQRPRLEQTLTNMEAFSADLRQLTGENADSLNRAVHQLNRTLTQADRNMGALETTTDDLNAILGKIQRSEGTLGLMVNDSTLYVRLDSTARNLNQLVDDFKNHPRRYLRHMTLIDIF